MHLTTLLRNLRSFGLVLSLFTLFSFSVQQETTIDNFDGGWRQIVGEQTHILLISGNYFSWTVHKTGSGAFISTKGGSWKMNGRKMMVTYEFDSTDPKLVGTSASWKVKPKGSKLQLKGAALKGKWEALDQGVASPLSGPWLFSGRKRNGEISRVDMTTRPRKTMKILTGNRFQWIAYNTETGKFHGTGGGSYTAQNGIYTENIEFFSRDDKRVGAKLNFNFEVKDGDWHHSGKSSSGQPMYEFWSRRK